MRNKKTIAVLMALAIGFSMFGCKKYPEGPSLSMLSKTFRLNSGTVLEQYIYGGKDITSEFDSVGFHFAKDYKYRSFYNRIEANGKKYFYQTTSGEWSFIDNKNKIKVTEAQSKFYIDKYGSKLISSNTHNITYTILKLKNNAVWLSTTDSLGIETIIHLK